MENVLSSLNLIEQSPDSVRQENHKNKKWELINLQNKYDSGALLAGMGDGEGSFHDFIIKFVTVLTTIAKTTQKKPDQKLFDLIKTSMLLYLDSLDIKRDNIKNNAEIVATVQGFVNQFVENSHYEDRL